MHNSKAHIGHNIIFLERVDSTNNYAANRFKSGDIGSGAVILTDIQTNGRGQRGKEWQSDAFSSLIVSVVADLNLWKINNIISLNHIVALSIQAFLKKYSENVEIKWPNDLMINDRKVAGILIESFMSSSQRTSIIGFGININQDDFNVPRATSLKIETGISNSPREMIYQVIDCFNHYIDLYHQKGENWVFDEYNKELWKLNQNHSFEFDGETEVGKIVKSTLSGELIVDFNNTEKVFRNGEVKY
ncbi:biotin--[acetyl-CoA-carboxylase] ligase [Brumimicrobium aurantiacum]|uniref:Biotin--[acetyl-CoA-carboxylase] ligase n=1 Tax=Brumimicrobium aurantiacum TaxID=1737063 RepID=A0A3E1EZD6_9FLAO|nr:biotin--[acetyl-CoA-carboxylase] ligase [Brumimicrobium aurantiacum]RFC54817.1 biotin--[acetyl-CoA-carboxylase] ligase [Brumimicrobium aurantiacum]